MVRYSNANKASLGEVRNEFSLGGQFHFVPIQDPDEGNDRKVRRMARSHAIARGLEKKRKLQQEMGHNFRVMTLKDDPGRQSGKRKLNQSLVASLPSFSGESSESFQMLAVESPRLPAHSQRKTIATLSASRHKLTLNASDKIEQAMEPVFTISDELVLQNFRSVLREALDDNALRSAFMLTLTFTVSANSVNREYLGYKSQALSSIRQRMTFPDKAISEPTLGAILLLAGMEARLGMRREVQLHMGAIKQLLDICRRKGVYLSDGIKRAIFWSDLNASVLTGSGRIVNHTTFSELQWRRDFSSPDLYILPPGFQDHSYLLGEGFAEVLEDISALQCIRDSTFFGREDVVPMARIDNHQASIQSRLVSLPNNSSISECCHLAAYLCSAMLRCKLWRTSTIPSHLSLQLLCKLQQSNNDPVWDDRPDMLAWLLHVGGAFAPTGTIRSDYKVLLRLNLNTRLRDLYTSWPELLAILKQFIWSEKAFLAQVQAFWAEVSD